MPRPLLTATAIVAALTAIPIATAAMAAVDTDTYREFDQFIDVFNRVKADYVDKVDDKTLIKGAIQGMLAALDPHSSYEDALDYQNLQIMTEGNYGGLGLTVQMEDGAIKVVAAQDGTPASKAGIKSGDYITHIDGTLIFGDTLDESIAKMRGKPGTKITLGLVRPGRDKPLDVTMVREVIVQHPVKWQVKGDVGYIDINTFSEHTGADTRGAIAGIDKALGHRPLGYIVDLREDGGGLLSQAIEVSDAFLDHGEIVSQRGREKTDIERFYAHPGDDAHGLPVVVLTDAGTASARARSSPARCRIITARSSWAKSTFGKGSVQSTDSSWVRTLRIAADHRALLHPLGAFGAGGRYRAPTSPVPQISGRRLQDAPRHFREVDHAAATWSTR